MNKRIKTIDGLRGLAVLFVVAFHLINNQISSNPNFHHNIVTKILTETTYFGWCGVDLFFVMSGFLISSILLSNRDSANFFKTFYIRRFSRIIPIYYLLLVIFFILKHTSIYDPSAYIFKNDIPLPYYFLFLQNFAMTSVNHFGPEAITPTWSLAVEEQFYLIIPFIVYYLKPKHLKYFIAFCLLCGPICRLIITKYYDDNFYGKYTLLISRIDSPIIGFAIALLNRNNSFQSYVKENLGKLQLGIFIAIIYAAILTKFGKPGSLNHTAIALIFGFILLLALYTTKGFLYKMLTAKWLVFVGGISYFLYLYHQVINGLLHLVIMNQLLPIIDGYKSVAITFLGFCITTLLAIGSYKYFESPLIKVSHKFKY
jgi:peptidoglycan/LPS O-acetylase OafA/YrhL